MQHSSVYLYPNKIDVYSLASSWIQERNRKVYNRNLKIYRSADNRIDLQVRSGDQKTKNVSGTTLVFNLISKETKDLILQKDCSIDDETIGRLYVTLTADELLDIESGYYEYSLIQETRVADDANSYHVTSKVPLFFDSQYGAIGVIEVNGDLKGEVKPSLEVKEFSYINPAALGEEDPEYYISSIINARPDIYTATSLHTFQFYYDNYEGDVIVQGSLAEGGTPAAQEWIDLDSFTVGPSYSDINYINVTGKYNWFRIKHTPSESNEGTLDKVLYR